MPETAPLAKRRRADSLSARWATVEGVAGVCIYGSVARGDASETSDIDIIVLSSNPELTSEELVSDSHEAELEDVSVRVYTDEDLVMHLTNSPIFAAHLRLEGVIAFDREMQLHSILQRDYPISVSDELNWQRKNLELYVHSERFGRALLFPLARLYSIGRATVFSRLCEQGVLEFDAPRAFATLQRVRPEWRQAIDTVGELRPFFQSVRSDVSSSEWPFSPYTIEARARFDSARTAIQSLLADSGDA